MSPVHSGDELVSRASEDAECYWRILSRRSALMRKGARICEISSSAHGLFQHENGPEPLTIFCIRNMLYMFAYDTPNHSAYMLPNGNSVTRGADTEMKRERSQITAQAACSTGSE